MPSRKGTGFKFRQTWVSTLLSCVSLAWALVSSSVLRDHYLFCTVGMEVDTVASTGPETYQD